MKKFIDKQLFSGETLELVDIIANDSKKQAMYAINSDCMLKYWEDSQYREIINKENNLTYVDGMGVIYAQKLLKLEIAKERIATTDLFPAMLDYFNSNKINLKIFLLGGKGDTAERVRKNFSAKYPYINIIGTHDGYFNKKTESENVINTINSLNVDILYVGFGCPIQEKWVDEYYEDLNVKKIITCGGLFDYYSNNVKRAPIAMQKLGLEWLFRLCQEPTRLYKRYIFGNIKYIYKVLTFKFRSIIN